VQSISVKLAVTVVAHGFGTGTVAEDRNQVGEARVDREMQFLPGARTGKRQAAFVKRSPQATGGPTMNAPKGVLRGESIRRTIR
jgi:hypothetical protein